MFYEHNKPNHQQSEQHTPPMSHAEAESVESSVPLIAGFLAYAAAFPVAMAVAAACTLALN